MTSRCSRGLRSRLAASTHEYSGAPHESGDDITLLSWGAPLYSCVEAANLMRNPPASIAKHVPESLRGANVEIIDLRTILPWDRESESAARRQRSGHP